MSPTESPGPRSGAERANLSADQPPLRTFDGHDRARVALPSREQLLDLVEHAGRRPLTSGEVYLLRLGVVSLNAEAQRAEGGQ